MRTNPTQAPEGFVSTLGANELEFQKRAQCENGGERAMLPYCTTTTSTRCPSHLRTFETDKKPPCSPCSPHSRQNAAVYGVEEHIEFILGDAMRLLPCLRADAVFLSPPWGGPNYQDAATFNINTMFPEPLNGREIFRAARAASQNVAFFLPRNVDMRQVAELARSSSVDPLSSCQKEADKCKEVNPSAVCELEQQFLNGKLKTTTAYFGQDLVADDVAACRAMTVGRSVDFSPSKLDAGDAMKDSGKMFSWSGQHVRFNNSSDDQGDDQGDDSDDQGDKAATSCLVKSGQRETFEQDQRNAAAQETMSAVAWPASCQRENELYKAWVKATF